MASSASTSRWLFRDLPRSYVVLAVSAAVVAVVAFSIDWSSPPPPDAIATQSAAAADELRYRGSIVVPTNTVGVCRTMTMDNRTGNLADGGYGKCGPDAPRAAAKEGVEQARLRAVGNAFRH
jgi:hypothetical protein